MITEKKLNRYMNKLMLIAIVTLMTFPCFVLNTAYAIDQSVAPLNELVLPEETAPLNLDAVVVLQESTLALGQVLQGPSSSERTDDVVIKSNETTSTVFETNTPTENIVTSLEEVGSTANSSLPVGDVGALDTSTNKLETSSYLPLNTTTTFQAPIITSNKARVALASYSKNEDIQGYSDPVLVLGTSNDSSSGVYSFSSGDSNNDETLLQYLASRFGIYFGFFVGMLTLIYLFYYLNNRDRLSNFGNNLIERK